jgi:hypothetical protein
MSTIVTRAGKGSPLTNTEVDDNFTNLNTDKVQVTGTPTNGQAIIWNGTVWVPGASATYPAAGIANSTGTAWGTSYSTTGSGTVVALATSPSFTTPILGTPQSGNFSTGTFTWPTFNQNTTGSAGSVANALTSGTGISFSSGTTYNGSAAITVTNSLPMVYPGAGIPNSTGTAWGTSYSTTGTGTVLALATSPSFTTPILGTPTSGNFSTGTFTWPTFNQNTTGNAATATTATTATNIAAGTNLQIPYNTGAGSTSFIVAPTVTSTYLQYNGTGFAWATVAAGTSLSNDTATTSFVYPLFAAATSGTASTVYTGNAKLLYKPSTGEFQASELAASNGLILNATTVAASYTIGTGYNAMSVGPVTVASGQSVTVSSGQRWLVL